MLEARLYLHDRLLGLCGRTNGSSDQTTPDQTFAAWLGMCARTRNSISLEPTRFTRLSCESEGAAAAAILRFASRRSVWPLALPCPVLPRLRLSVWSVCVGTEMSLLGRGPTPASDVGQVRCAECGVWCSSRLRRQQVLASAASQRKKALATTSSARTSQAFCQLIDWDRRPAPHVIALAPSEALEAARGGIESTPPGNRFVCRLVASSLPARRRPRPIPASHTPSQLIQHIHHHTDENDARPRAPRGLRHRRRRRAQHHADGRGALPPPPVVRDQEGGYVWTAVCCGGVW